MNSSRFFRLALPWLLASGPLLAGEDLEPAVRTSSAAVPPASAAPASRAAATSAATVPAAVPAGAAISPGTTPGKGPGSAVAGKPTRTAGQGRAQDRVDLENTEITGNRELPKVMYVVPWKRPDLGDLGGRPAKSLLDEVLEPVDRDVFRRQNQYFAVLQPDAPTSAPSAAAAPGAAAQNEK